jgi:chemotaxis protein CheC
MPFSSLSESQLGTLKELGQAGVAHGAAALSKLLGQRVEVCGARLNTSAAGLVLELLADGRDNGIVVMDIGGDGGGKIFIAFALPDAQRLLSRLLSRSDEELIYTEAGASSLKETANILGCAYLNALSDVTGVMLLPSPPDLTVGVQIPPLQLPDAEGLALQTPFFIASSMGDAIRGDLFLVPDAHFLERLLLTSAQHL